METIDKNIEHLQCPLPTNNVHVPNLRAFSALLFETREEIVLAWIRRESSHQMLEELDIELGYFKSTYGIPVVEYFVGVVEGTKELGDCPIMQKFIAYLTEKNITARDIFNLCMNLRRSLITHLFNLNHQVPMGKTSDLLEEVSDIFDGNLSGVLQTFSDLTREKDKKLQEQLLINKQQKQLQMILNLQNSIVGLVKNNKIVLANRKFFETVGIKNLDIFHKHYPKEWGFITDVDYQSELFIKKDYVNWFEKILSDENHPTVKVTIVNYQSQKKIIFILKASKIPDQQNQYIITMADVTSYEKQMQKLSSVAYVDPVTRVYNRRKFELTLKEFATKRGSQFIILDINQFNRLKKDYDKALVDELINKVAQFLKIEVKKNFSIFRIDGGTFALLPHMDNFENIEPCIDKVQTTIGKLQFYISEEISCSCGIMTIREEDDYQTVYERLNNLNESLKFSEFGVIKHDNELFEKQQLLTEENKQIKDSIRMIIKNNQTIEAIAIYKEIPVTWEIKPLQIKNATALFTIVNNTSLLFKSDKVYFKLPGESKTIATTLSLIDKNKKGIHLKDFHYIEDSILERKLVQVKPQKDFTILLYSESHAVTGIIQNISQKSLTMKTDNIEGFQVGGNATVDIILVNESETQKLITDVHIQIFKKVNEDYYIKLALLPDQENASKLKSYVSWRQMQIIKELKNVIGSTS